MNQKGIHETVRLLAYCPLCGRRDTQVEGQVLGESSGTRVLYLRCQHGKHGLITMLQTSGDLVSSVGLMTDLGISDVLRIKSQHSVSSDDVLRTHLALKDESFFSRYLSV